MTALDWILHVVIGATFAGVLVTVALIAGLASPAALLGAAAAGMVLAFPVGVAVRRAMVAPRAPAHADNDIAKP